MAARRTMKEEHTVRIRVSRRGIETSRSSVACVVNIEIDGHRLWSTEISASRGLSTRLTPWPPSVSQRLVGQSDCRVLTSENKVLWSGRVIWTPDLPHSKCSRPDFTNDAGQLLSVSKWGTLRPTFLGSSPDFQDHVIESALQVLKDLRASGVDGFIVGGTLLGAIREGKLLPHDDDADLAYLSRHQSPSDLILENRRIEEFLLRRGHKVLRHSWAHLQVLFSTPDGAKYYVDIFTAFYKDGHFNEPIHVRVPGHEGIIHPLTTVELASVAFPAPQDPAAWLIACYGQNWKSPDPSFTFETPLPTRRRFDAWFGSFNMGRNFWEEILAEGVSRAASHTIREHVIARAGGRTVIDLGAGDGEDAEHYSAAGIPCRTSDFTGPSHHRGSTALEEQINLSSYVEGMTYLLRCFADAGGASNCVISLNHVLATQVGISRKATLELLGFAARSGATVVTADYTELGRYRFEDPRTWHLPESLLRDEAREVGLLTETLEVAFHTDQEGVTRELAVTLFTHAVSHSPVGIEGENTLENTQAREPRSGGLFRGAGIAFTSRLAKARGVITGTTHLQDRIAALEKQLVDTHSEIDEIRRDERRIAELRVLLEDELARLATAGQGKQQEP